tara:strand:- start:51 stop:218 length:168 start_codon:yes stop_codon:yes gene_type:complete
MQKAIKKSLDIFAEKNLQVNLDSDAARLILSRHITKHLQLWLNQKELESIKQNEG